MSVEGLGVYCMPEAILKAVIPQRVAFTIAADVEIADGFDDPCTCAVCRCTAKDVEISDDPSEMFGEGCQVIA